MYVCYFNCLSICAGACVAELVNDEERKLCRNDPAAGSGCLLLLLELKTMLMPIREEG